MDDNIDYNKLSDYLLNECPAAEIIRELISQAKKYDLSSDSENNSDIVFRHFLKILIERDRSSNLRGSLCSSNQWAKNSREHHERNRDDEWKPDKDRYFLEKASNSHDGYEIEREGNLPVQSTQHCSYNASDLMKSLVSNRCDLSIMPAYTKNAVSTSRNVDMSFTEPMLFNAKMAQASNFRSNLKRTREDDITSSQNNIFIQQSSSAAPISNKLEMTHPSNFRDNPKITLAHNEIDYITASQSKITLHSNSSTVQMSSDINVVQTSSSSSRRKKTRWDKTIDDSTSSQSYLTVNESSCAKTVLSSLEMTENLSSYVTGIENCQSVRTQYHMISPQTINFKSSVKEIIQFTKSVLYPPEPNSTTCFNAKAKPVGCKMVSVGVLPKEVTKEIIKEIFEICGTIKSLGISKNYYCHIQFYDELSVENAMYFSGYKMKIANKDEAPYSATLNVYFQDEVNQDDNEYKQTSEHQENNRLNTPHSPVVCFTNEESSDVCQKLKSENTISATGVLINWLEKGVYKKEEAEEFYSMFQSIQNYVIRLQDDKLNYEKQLNESRNLFKKQIDANIQKLAEIGKIYNAACVKKCWDNFTQTQKTHIEMWKKQTEELKNVYLQEVANKQEDEEIKNDVSQVRRQYQEHIQKMQKEIDSLKCQLETTQKEVKAAQSEQRESTDDKISANQTTLQNSMKKVLVNENQKYSKAEAEMKELYAFKSKIEGEQNKDKDLHGNNAGANSTANLENNNLERDARLISLISSFLNIQHFGATVHYIWTYVHQMDSTVNVSDVESLMKRFPTLFEEKYFGTGSNLEKRWKFIGFQTFYTLC